MPGQALSILQINANRRQVVMDEVWATVKRKKYDVVLVSEANLNYIKRGGGFVDKVKGSMIIDISRAVPISKILSGSCFVGIISTKLAVFSVYMTPNCEVETFIDWVDELCEAIRRLGGRKIIVCGDFNAKHTTWGGSVINERGRILLEAVSSLDLVCVNGDSPTYSVPGRVESFIDLCFVNEPAHKVFKEWKVDEDVTLSDHKALSIVFEDSIAVRTQKPRRPDVTPLALEEFGRAFREVVGDRKEMYPEELTEVVRKLTEGNFLKKKKKGEPVYWWTSEIGEL